MKKPVDLSKVDVRKLLNGGKSRNTVNSYENAWKQYVRFCQENKLTMDAAALAQWRQHLINDEERSANTINLALAAIKAIFGQLHESGIVNSELKWAILEIRNLPSNALVERKRPNSRTYISPGQMRALCQAPTVSADDYTALRDRALMMTLASTGCRISECLNIKYADIRKTQKGYIVTGIIGKRQGEPRNAPLSSEAFEAIEDWMAFRPVSSPYIFTTYAQQVEGKGILYSDRQMTRQAACIRIKHWAAIAGLAHIKPHDFRRFVGTQLVQKKGIAVARKVLGHANIATTTKYDLEQFEEDTTEDLF